MRNTMTAFLLLALLAVPQAFASDGNKPGPRPPAAPPAAALAPPHLTISTDHPFDFNSSVSILVKNDGPSDSPACTINFSCMRPDQDPFKGKFSCNAWYGFPTPQVFTVQPLKPGLSLVLTHLNGPKDENGNPVTSRQVLSFILIGAPANQLVIEHK